MFDKEAKRIDAVTVGTPDHIHAVASVAAIRAGKHVYCQKPLTHTLLECRTLTQAARAAGVMTQMGNQGHATEGARLTNEWIQAGVIGEVREVHAWSDRAGLWWKNGIGRPTDTPPVPKTLDWNLWLGPVRERPYHPDLRAGDVEGLVGFRQRGPGRHGLPHHRPPGVGLGAGAAVGGRGPHDDRRLDSARQEAEHRDLSDRFDHHLRVSCPRRPPARDADLVRRRTDAADARRRWPAPRAGGGCTTTASSTSAARARCTTARTAACRSSCPPSCTKRQSRSPRR